jgi:hypothetical protein
MVQGTTKTSQLYDACSQIGISLAASEEVIETKYWTISQVLEGRTGEIGRYAAVGSFKNRIATV